MIERHLVRLRARDDISAEEESAIRALMGEVRHYPKGRTFIHAGEALTQSTLLIDGMMCRYKDTEEGKRQISELHIAGDFADLHSFTLKRLDHNIMALTPCTVVMVPHERLTAMTERYPHLTRVYWFSTNLDAAIHREWELSLGRRKALARVAQLFCELHVRLGIVGLVQDDSFALKLTQLDLSDCLGLTQVHINRTLKELREKELVTFRAGRVTIHSIAELRKVAEFDPAFLYMDRRAGDLA